jgi:hypothetical protein
MSKHQFFGMFVLLIAVGIAAGYFLFAPRDNMSSVSAVVPLNSGDDSEASSPTELASNQIPPVEEIQSLLTEMGYEPGPIDGVPGQRTSNALAFFSADRAIPRLEGSNETVLEELRAALRESHLASGATLIEGVWLPIVDAAALRELLVRNSDLIDAQSVQFRDTFFSRVATRDPEDVWRITCGMLNARNSFGGYVGFRYFYIIHKDDPSVTIAREQSRYGNVAPARDVIFFDSMCPGWPGG